MAAELFYYVLLGALFSLGCGYLLLINRKVGIQQTDLVGFSGM